MLEVYLRRKIQQRKLKHEHQKLGYNVIIFHQTPGKSLGGRCMKTGLMLRGCSALRAEHLFSVVQWVEGAVWESEGYSDELGRQMSSGKPWHLLLQ